MEIPLLIHQNLCNSSEIYGDEAFHAIKVLRLKAQDKIKITNGAGKMVMATISEIKKTGFQFEIINEFSVKPLSYNLHLAVAPTKNIDRYDFMVEKCTEIGFSVLTPIICNHSERKTVKTDRLQRIVNSAVKQSVKSYLPVINEPVDFENFITSCSQFRNKYLSLCADIKKMKLIEAVQNVKEGIIVIGPEGDLSKHETETALQNGFIPVSLGNSRLRTETAGIAACHTFYLVNE
jgi:16S rRNA (uracil1498-N3)-methyltransferase